MDCLESLRDFLKADHQVNFNGSIATDFIRYPTPGLIANQNYFDNRLWAENYFNACHRSEAFKQRWLAATGSWDNKVVVDIGCGPGNVYATVGGKPKLLIGVDVAKGSLAMAAELGYVPLQADAHDLPFISAFADLVILNATLHHCTDMVQVLTEAARIVKPGGLLVLDHDPQLYAWNYKGVAMVFYRLRHLIYRYLIQDLDMPTNERTQALATELHHAPGDGVTRELFCQTLTPLGFQVDLYPHNQTLGAEVLQGEIGSPPHWRYRLGQRLSGLNPNLPEAALSLMCVAQR
ncbi:MAG: class I SAM-dependent methyltransferase [Prochlorotrichaceae cyanobacterium]|jgi:ubiquinone/menaquinone biosynthesis C-methylase UbiE